MAQRKDARTWPSGRAGSQTGIFGGETKRWRNQATKEKMAHWPMRPLPSKALRHCKCDAFLKTMSANGDP